MSGVEYTSGWEPCVVCGLPCYVLFNGRPVHLDHQQAAVEAAARTTTT